MSGDPIRIVASIIIRSKQVGHILLQKDSTAALETGGRAVVLTAGAVAFIRRNNPNCVLCVVHGIRISGDSMPTASGGRISTDDPVDLSTGNLSPISYMYVREKP